jgi:hypothetical protein
MTNWILSVGSSDWVGLVFVFGLSDTQDFVLKKSGFQFHELIQA